jgi:hypothetical protein
VTPPESFFGRSRTACRAGGHPADDMHCLSTLARGCRAPCGRGTQWAQRCPHFFDSDRSRRLASGSPPRFESVALFGHSSADRGWHLAFRRRDHGRTRPVAILATVGCGSLDDSGILRADLPSRRPRQTERGGSISATAPKLCSDWQAVPRDLKSEEFRHNDDLLQLHWKTKAPSHCQCGGVVLFQVGPVRTVRRKEAFQCVQPGW